MYRHEKQVRDDALTGSAKHRYGDTHIRPVVDAFWKWCRESCERPELLPKSPLAKALRYARERRDGLEVFLNDPHMPIRSGSGRFGWPAIAPRIAAVGVVAGKNRGR